MFPYKLTQSGEYRLKIVPEKTGSDLEVNMLALIRYINSETGQRVLTELMFKGQLEEVKEVRKKKAPVATT